MSYATAVGGPMYYYPKTASLSYLVKAPDIESAAGSGGDYTVQDVSKCDEYDGCFRVCIELTPADLERMLGTQAKGVSIRKAYKAAQAAAEKHEAEEKD